MAGIIDIDNDNTSFSEGTLTDVVAVDNNLELKEDNVVYYCDFNEIGTWKDAGNSVNPTIEFTATGMKASGGEIWYYDDIDPIPYDSTQLYEISGRVKQHSITDAHNVYIGLEGIASDGTTLINMNGDNSSSSQHYIACSGYDLETAENWKTFRGYFTGNSTTTSVPANDPTNPTTLYDGVEYFRPMFLGNYNNGAGTVEIDYIKIKKINDTTNYALNKSVGNSHEINRGNANDLVDGDRATGNYVGLDSGTNCYMNIDLGNNVPLNQLGIFHYYSDERTYHETKTEIAEDKELIYDTPTPLADYSQWIVGTIGSQGSFSANGSDSENKIIESADPFGRYKPVWKCIPDSTSNADGGWNMSFTDDNSNRLRMTTFVKRTDAQDGRTYHGCDGGNTLNLDGSSNGNPYFWSGDLPNLGEWYLLVGIVHPNSYSGGDTGVAGVYDMNGDKVIDGTEYKWGTGTSQQMRNYLYYTTDTSVRQYFAYPRVDVIDGNEPSINKLVEGLNWNVVFDSTDSGEYTETSEGKWHGFETQQIRYIRDWVNGSTSNSGDHWVEIEGYGYPHYNTTAKRQSPQLDLSSINNVADSLIKWKSFDSLYFKGAISRSYIEAPHSTNLQTSSEITIEAWIKPKSYQQDHATICTKNREYYFQLDGYGSGNEGKLACYTYYDNNGGQGGSSYNHSNAQIPLDEWTHVAFTEDSTGQRKLYIDGELDSSYNMESSIWSEDSNPEPLGIGDQSDFTGYRRFDGQIAKVRLWDIERTQTELQNNMYTFLTGSENGLMWASYLNEGSGTTVTDIVNGNNGSIYNAHWLNVDIETSVDGGSTWDTVTNGSTIPNIDNANTLDVRQTLETSYTTVTPVLESLEVRIKDIVTTSHSGNGAGFSQVLPLLLIKNNYIFNGVGDSEYTSLNIVLDNYNFNGTGASLYNSLNIILDNYNFNGVGISKNNPLLIIENNYFGSGIGILKYNNNKVFYVRENNHIGSGEATSEFGSLLVGRLLFRGKRK